MSRSLRVMVVDDEENLRVVVADAIRFAGHDVVGEAGDGQQAVEQARQLRPDVVVMDVRMPRLNGDAAMIAMLREGTVPRVVLMSAEWRSLGLTRTELERHGMSAFLEKPFHITDLFGLLDQYAATCPSGG
jgi:CheY-like chemotaxis protein